MKRISRVLFLILLLTAMPGCNGYEEQDPPEFVYVQYMAFCDSCQTLELVYLVPDQNKVTTVKPQHTVYPWDFVDDPISKVTRGPDYNYLSEGGKMWKSALYKFNTTGLTKIELDGYNPDRSVGEITSIEIRLFKYNSEDTNSFLMRYSGGPGCDDIYYASLYCRWDRYSLGIDTLVDDYH